MAAPRFLELTPPTTDHNQSLRTTTDQATLKFINKLLSWSSNVEIQVLSTGGRETVFQMPNENKEGHAKVKVDIDTILLKLSTSEINLDEVVNVLLKISDPDVGTMAMVGGSVERVPTKAEKGGAWLQLTEPKKAFEVSWEQPVHVDYDADFNWAPKTRMKEETKAEEEEQETKMGKESAVQAPDKNPVQMGSNDRMLRFYTGRRAEMEKAQATKRMSDRDCRQHRGAS